MNSFNFRIFTFLLLIVSVSFGQDTYFDDFRDRTYSNSYGTINWSSNPWNEVNDNNSATGGFIRITNGGELRFREVYQNLEYLERTVDLSSASAVNLSFDWRSTSALASGFNLDVQINSGSGFVTLFTINGTGSNNSGTFSQDISSHISASTVIRIINTGPNWPDTNDTVFIDDVLFSLTTSPPSNPILLIEDVTVNEGDGSAVFTVTHTGGSASGSFNVGFTTGNGSAVAGNDYTAATGTLNFSGTTGDTETITVSIIDDLDDEPNETFSIEFTSKSDNSVNITDTATGTIVDNDDPKVLTINDVSVNEDDGTATFTVTHTGTNSSSSFTVDYATVDGTATAGSDYVAKTGTLNFNGTSGDTENITITITDDTNVDNLFETFTITLSSPSDSSFDVSDVGNGSIRDNDAILISDEGSVSACSDTFLDSGGIDGNYGINEDFTITICPDSPNKNVNIDFSSFSTENNFDFLFIYEDGSVCSRSLLPNQCC